MSIACEVEFQPSSKQSSSYYVKEMIRLTYAQLAVIEDFSTLTPKRFLFARFEHIKLKNISRGSQFRRKFSHTTKAVFNR
ncbi:hypothetical protein EUGRSUZ_E04370 [Eucalyptus grandis]|uniref:Uncharacterized protein n=2 Tax=Eucalyptus grandis TaxID=71139 RepID=A0ACC3L1K8_EUCGR|nr:hypothetical protein EUGRSUZ_E04370 [Eucalyptus grandis]